MNDNVILLLRNLMEFRTVLTRVHRKFPLIQVIPSLNNN